jgi:hypothetical protein
LHFPTINRVSLGPGDNSRIDSCVCLTAEIRFMLFALPQESIHAVCITAEEGGFSRPLKALKSLGL